MDWTIWTLLMVVGWCVAGLWGERLGRRQALSQIKAMVRASNFRPIKVPDGQVLVYRMRPPPADEDLGLTSAVMEKLEAADFFDVFEAGRGQRVFVTADPGCFSALPEEAVERLYRAVKEQRGKRVEHEVEGRHVAAGANAGLGAL